MIREIVKDPFFLQQKSETADACDLNTAVDLLDTLRAHEKECVGMAANMIGARKRIIAISLGKMNVVMLNPKILHKSGPYTAEEGCLSLQGIRKTKRYQKIELKYSDLNFHKHKQSYTGFTAQIIQHECDHLDGILI